MLDTAGNHTTSIATRISYWQFGDVSWLDRGSEIETSSVYSAQLQDQM